MKKVLNTLLWLGIGIIIGALVFSKCGHESDKTDIIPAKKIVA